MTRPGMKGFPDLRPLVMDRVANWAPPFAMCVIGDRRIFEALGPAVGPEGHISPGAHLWRTLTPLVTGYTNPGDGSYAAALREAHQSNRISPALLGESLQWLLNILRAIAYEVNRGDLVEPLQDATRDMAQDFEADATIVVMPTSVMNAHFGKARVTPEMRDAFWEVMRFTAIRQATGNPSVEDILVTCRRYLPAEFVDQFIPA